MNWSRAGEAAGQGAQTVEGGAVVGGGQTDEGVDGGGATQELDVVAGHHAALGVADHVDLTGAGGGQDLIDEGGQLLGRRRDVTDGVDTEGAAAVGRAVVEGEDAVAVVDEQR